MRRTTGLSLLLVTVLASPVSGHVEVTKTHRFELSGTPRVALHHFLIDWAMAEAGEWPPYATPLSERENWREVLNEEEQRRWETAVRAYDATRGRSLLFDEGLLAIRDWALGLRELEAVPQADRGLAVALRTALPVYQRHWWAAHDRDNRAWIEALTPLLTEVEDDIAARLAAAYGGRWPAARIPIDVVPYANPVGAYSVGGRLTISSRDDGNGMPQALELVFHEASHLRRLAQPLHVGLRQAFAAAGGEPPERFWHDVIFYTAGEVTRIVLAEHGEQGYRHYGEFGVYTRGERWAVELPALRRHWEPFLRTGSNDESARRAAMLGLARGLGGGG